jgi:hypothetical protein
VHGDLRATTVVLPSDPEPSEVAAMLDSFAHFTSVTGAAPTAARIVVGNAEPDALRGRDALIIARAARHPLLDTWRERLPLVTNGAHASVQYPRDATLLGRWLSGRFGDTELSRARAQLGRDPFGAVFGIVAPWDPSNSVVVLTGSDGEHLPRLSRVAGYAQGHELRNDLMIIDKGGLFLFQIGIAEGRGELPKWILVRVWFAHHWPLLLPALLLSAVAWGLIARHRLAVLARRRLRAVTS